MIRSIWNKWNQFWFEPVSLYNLAVFRILLCVNLAIMYLSRQRDVGFFYTDQGILPRDLSYALMPDAFRPFTNYSFWPDSFEPWAHAVFVLLLILMTVGLVGRLLSLVAVFLHLAFMFRNFGVAFGADQVATFFLLYLALTQSHGRLSVRDWWRKRQNKPSLEPDLLTSVFYRMIQIQLCLIYIYSGMEKLKGQAWWDGTAIWTVLANPQMVIGDWSWMRHFPLAIVFATFSTVLFEVYFPVLVWIKPLRKYFLLAGVLFHIGIGVIIALWSFAFLMITPYVLFVSESWLLSQIKKIQGVLRIAQGRQ